MNETMPESAADRLAPATALPEPGPARDLGAFLQRLAERYRALPYGAVMRGDDAAFESRLMSLELAEAAIRFAAPVADRPPQIAVLGPTQTGKSTLVNTLLGGAFAAVSPLAGFTVHAQGFCVGSDPASAWSRQLFPGMAGRERADLSRDELRSYSLTSVPQRSLVDAAAVASPSVVWDTPDFDSLSSSEYRRGVLEVAALADVHVLVLSKEKYSDLSVWRMLGLIAPLRRGLILAVNKLTDDAAAAIPAALRSRLRELQPALAEAPIVGLPYRPELKAGANAPQTEAERGLIQEVTQASRFSNRYRVAGIAALLDAHWGAWTAPIRAEADAKREWCDRVEAELENAAAAYRNEYLEHPERYDTFRRATIELLDLLEVPGVGGVLGKIRGVVTWPARQLFASGREWLQRRSGTAPRRSGEEAVLDDLIERVLTGLLREVVRSCARPTVAEGFWRALADRLDREQGRLRTTFAAAAQTAREDFAPEIQATANRLFEMLRERPVLLAGFRTARATADVAAIALAIKTGGAHLNDLLLAPATFALSSFLAEGALGGYMRRIAEDLKRRQLEHIRSKLFNTAIATPLRELATGMSDGRLFGVSAEDEQAAKAALETWRRERVA